MKPGALLLGLLVLAMPARAAETALRIPFTDEQGHHGELASRLCRPPGPGPFALVVINHGAPRARGDLPRLVPASCQSVPAKWFLTRGTAVLFALRRGFGTSTGTMASSGLCAQADFAGAGRAEARDVAAIVAFGRNLPAILPDRIVVIGQSSGGFATLAFDAMPHPPVSGIIIMAGGRGERPGEDCNSALLVDAVAGFGAISRTDMLWIYARRDPSFGPALATEMHQAFTAAGGSARLEQPDFDGPNPHQMLYSPLWVKIWAPLFDRYLAARPRR